MTGDPLKNSENNVEEMEDVNPVLLAPRRVVSR